MTSSGPDGPAQTAYAPPNGKGPIVGKDVLTSQQDGRGNLRKAIERAQTSPSAVPGKAAVIGFSRGGGGSLVVAAVVAYDPATSFVSDASLIAERFQAMRAIEGGARERSKEFEADAWKRTVEMLRRHQPLR